MHTELYVYEESLLCLAAGQQQASCGHFSDNMATLDGWLNRKKGKPPDNPPNAVATLSVQDDSHTGTNVTPEQAASSSKGASAELYAEEEEPFTVMRPDKRALEHWPDPRTYLKQLS
jgi:hypothetical protein